MRAIAAHSLAAFVDATSVEARTLLKVQHPILLFMVMGDELDPCCVKSGPTLQKCGRNSVARSSRNGIIVRLPK